MAVISALGHYQNLLELWLAAVATIGIYSFLYRDNKFYRILLHIILGLGVGYGFMITWLQTLGPLWWDPMLKGYAAIHVKQLVNGSFVYHTDIGHWIHSGGAWAAIYGTILGILGTFWYFQFSRKNLWISRIVIGMTMGAAAGMVFQGQFMLNMPQMTDSFRPLLATGPTPKGQYGEPLLRAGLQHFNMAALAQSFNNILYIAVIVGVMVYFFFSFSHDKKAIAGTAKFGRWMLMITFGAFFGNTVMTRMGVFLQRLQFLTEEWAPAPVRIFGTAYASIIWAGILAALFALIYVVWYITHPPSKPPMTEAIEGAPVEVGPRDAVGK